MELPKRKSYVSPEEFLEIRRTSEVPLEYMDGVVYERGEGLPPGPTFFPGNSRAHGLLVAALAVHVINALGDKPGVTSIGISVKAGSSVVVPDLIVYHNPGNFTEEGEALTDPVVIFEVLSDWTERQDHCTKWTAYQQVASLKHYVLIWQSEPIIEIYTRRAEGGWHYRSASGPESNVYLSGIDLTLALADIFKRVDFAAPETTT